MICVNPGSLTEKSASIVSSSLYDFAPCEPLTQLAFMGSENVVFT